MQIPASSVMFDDHEVKPCPYECLVHSDVCWECGEEFVVPEIPIGWMWHMAEAMYCLNCIRAGKVYKSG